RSEVEQLLIAAPFLGHGVVRFGELLVLLAHLLLGDAELFHGPQEIVERLLWRPDRLLVPDRLDPLAHGLQPPGEVVLFGRGHQGFPSARWLPSPCTPSSSSMRRMTPRGRSPGAVMRGVQATRTEIWRPRRFVAS